MIYFEDLEVGTERVFGTYHVTRDEILEFARKYDPQPFHLSDEVRPRPISAASPRQGGTRRR